MKQTIYKLDSKSKLRFLTIENKNNQVIQVSGLVDSDNPVIHVSECIAKNTGKTNATTAEEQALSEAKAKLKKKLEEGYYSTPEEAQKGTLILPMLAHDFNKHESKVKYPCFIQPKYDGMRMLAIKKDGIVSLISRKGKEITTLNHIKEQLEDVSIPDNIYDGEAYSLEIGTFQEQMKAIKKENKNTSKIDFNIYDIILDKPYSERLEILKNIFHAQLV